MLPCRCGCSVHPSPPEPITQHPLLPHRVQELKLEEQQWQLDQKLRCYMNMEGECQWCWGCPSAWWGERGWAVAHPTLLQSPAPSESLKTPEDRVAEKEILEQLLEVVNKRNVLIHIQEEKRLSELQA